MKHTLAILIAASIGCSTIPEEKHEQFEFPKEKAFVEYPKRKHKKMGEVKAKVDFTAFSIDNDPGFLCKNYYNRAVQKMVEYAEKEGADAIAEIRSVVFEVDGQVRVFETPECYNDGAEGQILTRARAIKWKKLKKKKKKRRKKR